MKRIIKKNTTITKMIVNDSGETFIIDRKQSVRSNHQLIIATTETELKEWKRLDQIYRQEIAKEMEEYEKKNLSSSKGKENK